MSKDPCNPAEPPALVPLANCFAAHVSDCLMQGQIVSLRVAAVKLLLTIWLRVCALKSFA